MTSVVFVATERIVGRGAPPCTKRRLGIGFGIAEIVRVALQARLHSARRHQLHVMAVGRQSPAEMVRPNCPGATLQSTAGPSHQPTSGIVSETAQPVDWSARTARRRAARASRRVESSVGSDDFVSSIINGNSVQPRIMASHPASFSRSVTVWK